MRSPSARPRVVPDLIAHAAKRYPERACAVGNGRTLSFAEVDERAQRLAGALLGLGLETGDRVALLAYNEPEFFEIRAACQRAGVVLVPLNYRLTVDELRAILEDSQPRVLVHAPELRTEAERLPTPTSWELRGEDDHASTYERALAGSDTHSDRPAIHAERPGAIMYTSGTTGAPKGAVLSNAALHAGLIALGHEMAATPDAVYLAAMPMFHIGVQVGYGLTYLGATTVLLRRFDVDEALTSIERHGITHTQLVPTMIRMLLDSEAAGEADLRSLRRVMYGAAPMPPTLLETALERIGCTFINTYGLTEALAVSVLPAEDHDPKERPELLGSVGKDGISLETRIVDEYGGDVATDELGEIVCRGPTVMDRYWQKPDETAEVFFGEWFRTGDLGYRSEAGYLYLTDRRADKIVTGGENVFPTEVENILFEHHAVQDVAVIGVPDDHWGEAVHAVVVARSGKAISQEQLVEHCRANLAPYKVPKSVEFRDELPRTTSGKIRRNELRAEHGA